MGYPIQQNQTAQPLLFLMVDSADHIAGKAGLSPTVTLSKNGAAFAAPDGAVTEVGNGWYKVAPNAIDAGTLGPLTLHASAAGADPTDDRFDVVAYNPQDAAAFGLTNLDAAISSRNAVTPPTAVAIRTEMDASSTKLANIPAGLMPTQAEVLSIQNNTRTTIGIPTVAERPDSGSTPLKIYLNNYDTIGNMEAPDSAPTVAVANEAGTTRSGNLQHPTTHVPQTTMVNLSAGRYWIEYDLDNADTLESLVFTFSIIEGGVTRVLDRVMLVVDTTAVDFTDADRTKLNAINAIAALLPDAGALTSLAQDADLSTLLTRIPGVVQPQTGDSFAAIAALNDLSTAEILAMIFEGTETLQDYLRLSRSVLYGILTGGATSTITMRDRANLKNRITATVDANGNRSVVTTDAA